MKRLAALIVALVLVAGCSSAPAPIASEPRPTFTPAEPAVILKARKQAGIADCPRTAAEVPTRSDGLPDLTLDCLGGDSTVRLSALRGKPMVINLWAQWCAPCREESPWLKQYAADFKGKVLLMGVNYDDPRPELAVEFASLVGWKYPQLHDPERRLSTVMSVPGLPLTLFVAADGRIVHRVAGKLQSYDELVSITRDELGVRL